MEIRIKEETVEQRIAELKSKLPGIADQTEARRVRKQIRSLQTKLKEMRGERVERKDYLVKARFVFEGTFKVYATSKDDAKRIVRENCGMRSGEIYSTVPNVLDWDFKMHPVKNVR